MTSSTTTLTDVSESVDQMILSSGGSLVEVNSTNWTTVQAFVYPSSEIKERGLRVDRVWVAAEAGDSSIGVEIVLEDNAGRVLAGPVTSFGGTVPQLMGILPVRVSSFPRRSVPAVLVLRARNRREGGAPSKVGGVSIHLQK